MSAKAQLLKDIVDKELELVASYRGRIDEEITTGALNQLSLSLSSLVHSVRETVQEVTAADMQRVIGVLERGEDVTPEDLELIRAWMVGDAAAYVRLENDFKGWIAELGRLVEAVCAARGRALSAAELMDLRGQTRDALRTAADIQFFQQQRERVRSFEEATATWSADDKRFVARMLRQKLASSEV